MIFFLSNYAPHPPNKKFSSYHLGFPENIHFVKLFKLFRDIKCIQYILCKIFLARTAHFFDLTEKIEILFKQINFIYYRQPVKCFLNKIFFTYFLFREISLHNLIRIFFNILDKKKFAQVKTYFHHFQISPGSF